MSIASLIQKYGKLVTLSKESSAGTTNDEGIYIPATPTTSSIYMSIQPLTGDEAIRLPEGIRNKKVMKGYTVSDILSGSETAGTNPDQIIDGSTTYEVNAVEFFEANTLGISPHYKCLLVRVNQI